METQLLCTFTDESLLDATVCDIVRTYDIVFDSIYILENIDTPNTLCCTYNVNSDSQVIGKVPDSTISLHRKKSTNTLYTINALNLLVSDLNGGKVDKNFPIPWDNYKNTILVTAYGKLKQIPTKLKKIIKIGDIK